MQSNLLRAAALAALVTTVAGTASAQGRGRSSGTIPPGFRPPAGMCRVWIQGLPPGQQPGVTDCLSARANVPANGRIVYGSRYDNPSYRGRTGTFTRTLYDPNGNRVFQRVRRNSDGTLSILSSQLLGGTVIPNVRNTGDCSYQSRGKSGKVKMKCRGGDDDQGEDRDEQGDRGDRGDRGNGKGHGKHGH
jgi:hypothetical protein